MRIKIISLFIILFCCVSIAGAQNVSQSTVYMKNGSVIHGKIIEWKPEVSITVSTKDSSKIIIAMSDIDKISWEENQNNNEKIKEDKPATQINFRDKGLSFAADASFNFYVGEYSGASPGIHAMVGYHFSEKLCLSVATGFEYDGGFVAFPVYADCKIYFNNNPGSALLGVDAGYNILQPGGGSPGFTYGGMGQLYFGARHTISKNVALNFVGGYRIQAIYLFNSHYNGGLGLLNGAFVKIGFMY